MPKRLLNVLAGRSRPSDVSIATSSKLKIKSKSKSKSASFSSTKDAANKTTSNSNRRCMFDDKSGPPAPRGSVTVEKLSYLDWRLKRINAVRTSSEGTDECWIDGRNTIGRTSFEIACIQEEQKEADEERGTSEAHTAQKQEQQPQAPAPAVQAPENPIVGVAAITMAAVYQDEKESGLKALEHAMAADSVIASMPRLAKQDSSSGSDLSGSSDQHHQQSQSQPFREEVRTKSQQSSKKDKTASQQSTVRNASSFLRRASQRFGSTRNLNGESAQASKTSLPEKDTQGLRRNSPLARLWQH